MKKEFACNGHVVHSAESDDEDSPAPAKKDEHGKVLQFQGDQRTAVKDFLLASGIVAAKEAKDQIVIHGY
jgi:translation initiation factor 1